MDSVAERDSAYQDIKVDGVAMTLQRNVQGVYNVTTQKVTNTVNSLPTYGLIKNYKLFEINGTLIKQGDKLIIMAAVSDTRVPLPEPTGDDNILINGVAWTVKDCESVSPAGIPILYKIHVRR